jgi:predicted nucleic acid-binding protein
MRVYLDTCCLNRPFDDLGQDRIRLESEAVLAILARARARSLVLVGSDALDLEIAKIPDEERRRKVGLFHTLVEEHVRVDEAVKQRARALHALGWKPFDALHLACAERGEADIVLTTDDRLLHRASQDPEVLRVRVENPVRWFMEELAP